MGELNKHISAALLAACMSVAAVSGAAHAQTRAPAAQPEFSIPGGAVGTALVALGRQAGFQVSFAPEVVQGKQTQGVSGTMSPTAALSRVLAGTGLSYRSTGPRSVAIFNDQATLAVTVTGSGEQLPPIEVQGVNEQGYVPTVTAAATKTSTPIIETPQSISIVTRQQLQEQAPQTVGQALRYTPGVFAEGYGGGSQFDAYTMVRGFQADFFLDGMRLPNGSTSSGWASAVTEPYGLERMEVLKGPSSGLYGETVPGGLINMVSKRPTEIPFGEVQFQTGSFDRKQVGIDVGGPIDKDKQFLYRLTAMLRDSGTQVDFMENNRGYVAPAFTWRPSANTTWTFLANYQKDWGGKTGFNYVPTSGTLVANPNGQIPYNRYLGDPFFDQFTRQQAGVGYLFEHSLNNAVTLRQNLRFFEAAANLRALNRSGELLADNQTLRRAAFGIDTGARVLSIDNSAEFKFATGAFTHDALVGFDYRRENNHYNVGFAPPVVVPAINVFNPVYGVAIPDPGYWNANRIAVTDYQVGTYVQDQIKLDRWVFTLGGRYDQAKADSVDRTKNNQGVQDDNAWTGRVGLNYLFDNGAAPYVSYATSFRPTFGFDAQGRVYKPTTGDQIEGGIKYQPANSRTLVTLAAFEINQQNRLTNDVANPGFTIQTAGARIRGFEAEARSEVLQGLNVIASYTYLDNHVTESSIASDVGKRLAKVPNNQASLWAMYELQQGAWRGFGFGGGVRYVGETFDVANTTRTPDYMLFDARLQYDLGNLGPQWKGATFSVNGFNLADKYYLTECTTGQGCTLGYRRTILATLTYRW